MKISFYPYIITQVGNNDKKKMILTEWAWKIPILK
ncbi:hypothetical protein lse_1632 [Listeria seeligeri serovar 1/2b str. SLCC3954]|nr:hypothetical protein lse_1632 [Listeria seeligeri serovar 1/2b str. SLCC3954]